MNWLDYLIITSLCLFAIMGFRRGIIREVLSIAAVVLGFVVALRSYEPWASFLEDKLDMPLPLLNILAFAGIFIITCGVLLLIGRLWKFLTEATPVAFLDGFLGALFGVMKAVLLLGLIMTVLINTGMPLFLDVINSSYIAPKLVALFPAIYTNIETLLPVDMGELPFVEL
jgi:membrane protein required for colicin V production